MKTKRHVDKMQSEEHRFSAKEEELRELEQMEKELIASQDK